MRSRSWGYGSMTSILDKNIFLHVWLCMLESSLSAKVSWSLLAHLISGSTGNRPLYKPLSWSTIAFRFKYKNNQSFGFSQQGSNGKGLRMTDTISVTSGTRYTGSCVTAEHPNVWINPVKLDSLSSARVAELEYTGNPPLAFAYPDSTRFHLIKQSFIKN